MTLYLPAGAPEVSPAGFLSQEPRAGTTDGGYMQETVIGMLVFPDFQLLDVAGPLDVFAATPGLRPVLIASTRAPVAPDGLPGVHFTPDSDFEKAPPLDVVFVPGGHGIDRALRDRQTLAFLRDRGSRARYVTSVCTGALVLGAAGLLQGYRAATHWRYLDLLPLFGAQPVDERVVRDRNRITSGGVTAGIDFGLVIAAELLGEAAAQRTQLDLQYAPEPPFQAGHPSTAPQHLVEESHSRNRHFHRSREVLLREVLQPSQVVERQVPGGDRTPDVN